MKSIDEKMDPMTLGELKTLLKIAKTGGLCIRS
jgi:hypothetical protein